MNEYIERERLLRRFNIDDMMNVNGTLISLEDARNTISNFPAADVAPVVHGKWLHTDYALHWTAKDECSECTYHALDRDDLSHYNYCPNCGAKMDEEDIHE